MKKTFTALTLVFAMTFSLPGAGNVKAYGEKTGNSVIADEAPPVYENPASSTDAERSEKKEPELKNKASAQDALRKAPSKDALKKAPAGKIDDPYHVVNFIEEFSKGALVFSEPLSEDCFIAGEDGVYVNAGVDALNSGRILINDTFNFNGNPVGRVSVNALSNDGITGIIDIYIDDEEIPAASIDVKNNDGVWESNAWRTEDIYARRLTGEHSISIGFTVSGDITDGGGAFLLKGIEFEESSVPVVYLNIDESKGTIEAMNSSYDHSDMCYGSMDIQVPDGFVSEYTGKAEKDYTGLKLEYIRGRGNSTWWEEKKPYKIKLDKGADLFGMGKNKHWVLLADVYDNSHMRNRMTYWLGAELGIEYTPQCIPVEVVMNDVYYGTYLLCEQIRIGKSRVDIDELTDDDYDDPIITGGYLLAMNPYPSDPTESKFTTSEGVEFLNKSPDFYEEGNEAQKQYIRDYVQKAENAVCGDGLKDENGVSYKEYIDLKAAVDYWWIQELAANSDAYCTSSTYLYKPRNDKLYWGPLWDFDYVAWGDLEYDEDSYQGFTYTDSLWFDKMKTDKEFCAAVKQRWPDIDEKLEEITREGGLLDRYYEQQRISERYNYELWGRYNSACETYLEEVDDLRNWIKVRREWINEHYDNLDCLAYNVYFYVDGTLIGKGIGLADSQIVYAPEAPKKEGYVFTGWKTESGEPFEIDFDLVESDTNLYGEYIDKEKAVMAEDIFFLFPDMLVNIYNADYIPPMYSLYPLNQQYAEIKWSSSDEDIATVDESGAVMVNTTGDVTITATLGNGNTGSYRIHAIAIDEEAINCDKMTYPQEVKMYVGEYKQIIPEVEPEFCDRSMDYMTDEEAIAVVDYCGVVTAVAPGTTYLHAKDWNTDQEVKCKITVTEKPVYKFIKGADSSWKKGSKDGLTAVIELQGDNASTFSHFTGAEIDHEPVDKKFYTAESGSVKLTIKPEYLETLAEGKHTLGVIFDDGSVESAFTVLNKEEEKTEEKTERKTEEKTEGKTEGTTEGSTEGNTRENEKTTEKKTEGNTSNSAAKTDVKKIDSNSKTGDMSPVESVSVIMIFAGAILFGVYRKKRSNRK